MARKRVLVVDDDGMFRALVRETLEQAGLEVLEAEDAAGGLALVYSARPDLLVTDIMMPGFGNGVDALKALRKDPSTSNLPVVVLSGSASASKLEARAESGRTWVFSKPPDWPALVSCVLKALA